MPVRPLSKLLNSAHARARSADEITIQLPVETAVLCCPSPDDWAGARTDLSAVIRVLRVIVAKGCSLTPAHGAVSCMIHGMRTLLISLFVLLTTDAQADMTGNVARKMRDGSMKQIFLRLGLLAGLALVSNTGFSAEPQKDVLQRLKQLLQKEEKFNTPSFQLLWAREAYRCGNAKGAFHVWKTLAKDENVSAHYILSLFEGWDSLSDDKSEGAIYALQLFRPGDGTSKVCQIGRSTTP